MKKCEGKLPALSLGQALTGFQVLPRMFLTPPDPSLGMRSHLPRLLKWRGWATPGIIQSQLET